MKLSYSLKLLLDVEVCSCGLKIDVKVWIQVANSLLKEMFEVEESSSISGNATLTVCLQYVTLAFKSLSIKLTFELLLLLKHIAANKYSWTCFCQVLLANVWWKFKSCDRMERWTDKVIFKGEYIPYKCPLMIGSLNFPEGWNNFVPPS